MILAGDVGGTKTLLGVFEGGARRPTQVHLFRYSTTAFTSFADLLASFERDLGSTPRFGAVAIGVAGPVVGRTARLTNHTWAVDADEIAAWAGAPAALLNDLEAMSYSLDVLERDEQVVLQAGVPQPDGDAALLAAGTGLGEATLHRVNGHLVPAPSEAGHADFAARSEEEWALARMLIAQYGRATIEHVLSGRGLVNLYRFTHGGESCTALHGVDVADHPAAVTRAALAGGCDRCSRVLRLFVSIYGAEAGNLALRTLATAGLYVGGGIVRHVLPAIQRDRTFMDAFLSKAPMEALLERIPVRLILNADTGILGAAVHAQSLVRG